MKGLTIGIVVGIILGGLTVFLIMQPSPQPPEAAPTITVTSRETTTLSLTSTIRITESYTTTILREQVEISEVCFSRVDECDRLLAGLIDGARRRVHVAIYSFTSDLLADALIRARMRGVEVLVVMDADQASVRGSEYVRLRAAGVEVRLDGNPSLMHHKFMIIDDSIVVTGSYNWSAAAEDRNDENIVVIVSEELNQIFGAEFQRVWRMAVAR